MSGAENLSEKEILKSFLANANLEIINKYLYNREFIDLAEEFPSVRLTPQEYIENLKRLSPRLYSIASSPKIYPNEVHLTVAVLRYTSNHRERVGVASTYLTDRLILNKSEIPVFISHSHFKLPENPAKDIIMVGPGTGVAPFRAFIQDHLARKGTGRTWLFFGERTKKNEYLYGDELDNYDRNNQIQRLDLAFSRDQPEKVYVQHKMAENAEKLWEWIQSGAHFYVCGDAKHMAKDVEAQFMQILQNQGNMSEEEAKVYFKQMKKEKRYQKDVY